MSLDLSATATRLLAKLGSITYVELVRVSGATIDPVGGTITGGSTTKLPLTAAVLNVADNLIDGERIKTGDKQVIFDNSETPVMTDLIEFDGIQYSMIVIDGFNHAGIQQFWKVICRA